MRTAWQEFGVRLWHPADLAALDDDDWQAMKAAMGPMGGRDA